jgi:hypothetical protein
MPHWRADQAINRHVGAIEGTVAAVSGTTTTVTTAIGTIPTGAHIFAALVQVTAAFNAGTTNVLTVGHSATIDAYVAAADVTEATPGAYVTYLHTALTADKDVIGTYSCTGTAPTTGSADITLLYSV